MAKKFSFRLEPLLRLRSYKVEEAKDSLNMVLRVRIQKELAINDKKEYFTSLLTDIPKKVTAADLQAQFHHKVFITDEITGLEQEKRQVQEIENIRRSKLSEVMKDEKILLKLKEKKSIEYNREVQKEEMMFLDEISIQRSITKEDE